MNWRFSATRTHPTTRSSQSWLRVYLLVLCLPFIAPLSRVDAGAIYKSVDSNGNVIFTDQPLEGAETLENTNEKSAEENAENYDGKPADNPDAPKAEGVLVAPQPKNPPKRAYKDPEPSEYLPVTNVEILTPIHGTTLHDPVGLIWVELQSYPTPMQKSGLMAQLWMNDELVNSGQTPMLSLPTLPSGTHVLQISLVDSKGQLFLKSKPVQIQVKYKASNQ